MSGSDDLALKGFLLIVGLKFPKFAIPVLIQNCSHKDNGVRFAVACALGKFANDPGAIQTLMVLMQDRDGNVRDWATFGLGVLGKADSPEIRDALLQRTSDLDSDAREEAFVALAKRKESRAIPALISILKREALSDRIREAAELFLGEGEQPEKWNANDLVNALSQRFPL